MTVTLLCQQLAAGQVVQPTPSPEQADNGGLGYPGRVVTRQANGSASMTENVGYC